MLQSVRTLGYIIPNRLHWRITLPAGPANSHTDCTENAASAQKKERLSITLSQKTLQMISDLRISTDADSDSEVIRNSIRLAYALMKAQGAGASLKMESQDGTSTPIASFGNLHPVSTQF